MWAMEAEGLHPHIRYLGTRVATLGFVPERLVVEVKFNVSLEAVVSADSRGVG